ncbi:glycosyltransferase family A protein [Sinomicrobium oceani]|uniref:glycosyltransferase family A protein n=1 Tax=Sinomicrobium oceani TaxID=1150368 RepID=UPI00227B3819|nr:glycosyltransferase family A protein [Sinomicrobium oceani]
METIPLISCICVTRKNPLLLHRAITCFLNQTYKNKELIVVYDDDDLLTKDAVKNIGYSNVSFYEIKKNNKISLGGIRNYAIEKSKGKFICQWDDDDWYHVSRIERQYAELKSTKNVSCVMTQWLIFDSMTNSAYLSHKRLWEGSLLCEKTAFSDIKYENINKGEDTSVIHHLMEEGKMRPINDVANLYIYVYHGANTWNYTHWTQIFNHSTKLNSDDSIVIKDILENYENVKLGSQVLDNLYKCIKS